MSKKMAINFDTMIKQAEQEANNPALESFYCLVCGVRQGGKSTLLGTVTGRMLPLTTNDEKHCIPSARAMADKTYGAEIVPFVVDVDPDTKAELDNDAAYRNILGILDSLLAQDNPSGYFQWVAMESANSVFNIVNNTKAILALSDSNKFKANETALMNFLAIINKLSVLNEKGINILVTVPCAADQNKITGIYDQVEPIMQGYRNNMNLTGAFGDILFVGAALVEDKEGNSAEGRYLQFMGKGDKSGKKASTGKVQYANFKPRLAGLLDEDTPGLFEADLTKLLKYKKKIIKRNKKALAAKKEEK